MLRIILPHVNNSRVASPGREHCHSPVKGCWLARSHRHSRYSPHQLSETYHPRAVILLRVSTTQFVERKHREWLPKRVNSRSNAFSFSRGSGAWYRAVCVSRGPMSGIGSPVSLCPSGRVGSNPTPGANNTSRCSGKCEEDFVIRHAPGVEEKVIEKK